MTPDKAPKVVTPPADEPTPDSAPKAKAKKTDDTKAPRQGRPSGRANRTSVERIENALNDGLTGLALAFQMQGNDVAAVIVSERGPKVAQAWAELARQNTNVRKMLERLLQGTAWSGVIVSTLGLALPLAQAYGVYPVGAPNPFGLTPAEIAKIEQIRAAKATFSNGGANGAN